jgi:16S rRNA (guanine(966)-N(2))-methyltransferase RsmD
MAQRKGSRRQLLRHAEDSASAPKPLRIIGGTLRGRAILYSGDQRTRPMKDRLREAVFDVLATAVKDKYAIDLFAGTGALGLEALSRGAARVTLIERHFPTARLIEQNIASLGIADRASVYAGDAFLWPRQRLDWTELTLQPWLVLCSPPWAFLADRTADMVGLINVLHRRAPAESEFVIEADEHFDFGLLADLGEWEIREYPPAVIGFHRVREGRQSPVG